jgi:hypothetical protein
MLFSDIEHRAKEALINVLTLSEITDFILSPSKLTFGKIDFIHWRFYKRALIKES